MIWSASLPSTLSDPATRLPAPTPVPGLVDPVEASVQRADGSEAGARRHSCASCSCALAFRREAQYWRIRSATARRCSSLIARLRLPTALVDCFLPPAAASGTLPSIASSARCMATSWLLSERSAASKVLWETRLLERVSRRRAYRARFPQHRQDPQAARARRERRGCRRRDAHVVSFWPLAGASCVRRIERPFRSMRCASWSRRSQMASA